MQANQVLTKLGITRVTLSHYVKQGKIKVTKLENGRYNYSAKSVNQLYMVKNSTCMTYIHGQEECLKSNPYKQYVKNIKQPFMYDSKLSNDAKLFMFYVFENIKDLRYTSPYSLQKILNVGYNKICKIITELKKYGYLQMKRTGWCKWIYNIFYVSLLQKTMYNYYKRSKSVIDSLLNKGWSSVIQEPEFPFRQHYYKSLSVIQT